MAENGGDLQALCRRTGVLSANRGECGWGVWCDWPTVFAACPYTLQHDFRQLN